MASLNLASQPTEEQYLNCIRCGLCLAVCPTYREDLSEITSPRGRVALARKGLEGELELTPNLFEQMYACFDCLACNAICPGWVLTSLVKKQIDARAERENIPIQQAEHDLLIEKQPSGKFTTVEQLGALVVFLCSPAGDNITGVPISVDGGWTAQ